MGGGAGMFNGVSGALNGTMPSPGGFGSALNPEVLNQAQTSNNGLQPNTQAASLYASGGPAASLLNAMAGPVAAVAPTSALKPGVTSTPAVDSQNMFNANVGMATATPMAATTTSNPNTATLGTGQTANPFNAATNPYIQAAQATTMGNLYGAQAATQANRINQNTPYANLNYTQSLDANGNPVWTANQQLAQPLQTALGNIQGQLAQNTANPFDVSQYQAQTGQGYTGMEGWDRATNLINQRLQPQIEQSQERLQAQLANQGIAPGTEAYNRAMTQQAQKTNDLMNQAQLAGSQVQNQMQGQSLAQQQANNAALQQNYSQALAQRNLPLSQLGAFQQATQPGYINPYSQAAVAGPDYLGAFTTSRAADIAQQNAANAKAANLQSGLFGLGSSAILGAGGVGNIIGSVGNAANAGTGLLGLGSSAYNTFFGNNGLNNPFVSAQGYMNNIGATSSGAFDPALSDSSYLENLYGDLGIF
jgi:hypothetical protein